jgi:hypothetical protein
MHFCGQQKLHACLSYQQILSKNWNFHMIQSLKKSILHLAPHLSSTFTLKKTYWKPLMNSTVNHLLQI